MDPSDAPAAHPGDDRCPQCGHEVGDAWLVCAWCGQQLAAAAELAEGSRLSDGRYQILRVIGRGGFGITYEVGDRRLQRRVAMKELFPESAVRHGSLVLTPPQGRAGFRAARDRFLREARVLARFTHPGIVRVYEVFEEHGTAYLVMELLEGRTLIELLQQRGRAFPEAEVLDVAGRVAAALRPVHAAGVLHRDINPSNVMLTHHGRIVVIDFGLARDYDEAQTVGMTRVVTPGYAPLEQYRGEGRFGPSTDVYGLAATCYRLATGKVPVSAIERDGGGVLPSPAKLNPAISKAVSDALLDGLELEPGHRPQDLDGFLSRLGISQLPDGPRSFLLDTVPPPVPEPPVVHADSALSTATGATVIGGVAAAVLGGAGASAGHGIAELEDHEGIGGGSVWEDEDDEQDPDGWRPSAPVSGATEVVGRAAVPVDQDATRHAPPAAPTAAGALDGTRTEVAGRWAERGPDSTRTAIAGPPQGVDTTAYDGGVPSVGSRPPFVVPAPIGPPSALAPPPPPPRVVGLPADPRLPLAVGPHRPGRRKLLVPLFLVALATGSAAPVLVTALLVLLVLPAIATLGDSVAHRLRAEHGVSAGWAERRMAPGALAPARFVRNVVSSVLRASPLIGIGAVLLAGWYGLERFDLARPLSDLCLRAIGVVVVGLTVLTQRDGSARFRTGLGLDELTARWVPGGRATERVVVFWVVAAMLVAAALWLSPDPFPLP